ncbi:MAG: hypothetical protein PHP00_15510 [Thiotrichaceae bacterium]|nr:hypothetical protein [Thiotrichaceae bacterium]
MNNNEEISGNVPEYYGDSLGVMLSPVVSKITVISLTQHPESGESVKTLKAQIVVPTVSLLGIFAKVLKDVKQSGDIIGGLEDHKNMLLDVLKEITIVEEGED